MERSDLETELRQRPQNLIGGGPAPRPDQGNVLPGPGEYHQDQGYEIGGLVATRLTKSYKRRPVVRGVSLSVRRGEAVPTAVLGERLGLFDGPPVTRHAVGVGIGKWKGRYAFALDERITDGFDFSARVLSVSSLRNAAIALLGAYIYFFSH